MSNIDPSFPAITADVLEDQYINLFKSRNVRAIKLFEFAEALYNKGKLTVGDVAGFVNDVMNVDEAVEIMSKFFSASFIYSVLSNASLTADKVQSILYLFPFSSKLVDIITYGASDLTVTANTTITGVNRYRTLTVSGVTLSCDGQPSVIIAKTIFNNGSIAKTATGGAGGTPGATGAGAGGAGGGGLIIFCDSLIAFPASVLSADGVSGASGSTVSASGKGGGGGAGAFIRMGDPVASGGGGGTTNGGANGGGGGYTGNVSYTGGSGGGSSVTDVADLFDEVKKAVVDWFIVNVLGKTPTSTKAIPNVYGSGGGGGGAWDAYGAGGGGGGGGGEIIILCRILNNNGTIRANGGNGGNGGSEGSNDSGGGGGGGGFIYIFYKIILVTGTIQVNGGSGGTGDFNGSAGASGVVRTVVV
jgi:hypothetical protein